MRCAVATAALALLCAGASGQEREFPLPPKEWPPPVMDDQPHGFLLLDRLEYQVQHGVDSRLWDAHAWFGGDYNKLWLKSEGTARGGRTEDADMQVLYARRVAPFWHLQLGARSELRPRPSQNYGVIALQGLLPYWFNMQASAFIRGGRLSGRLESDYDQRLAQRLVLQPRIEANFSGKADPARGVGNGIKNVELGLRLRYEIRREFAPYIGVSWRRKLGDTANLARTHGEDVQATSIVLGLRAWY